jgi:hypothetical protein
MLSVMNRVNLYQNRSVKQEAVYEVIHEVVEHQDDDDIQQHAGYRLGVCSQAEGQNEAEYHQQIHCAPLAVPSMVGRVVGALHLCCKGLLIQLLCIPQGGYQRPQ